MHVVNGTPGAALVLGATFATIAPGGDGQSVAGVPIAPGAVLKLWGGFSIAANTIGNVKLQSQDQPDPINGETYTPGAASLINLKCHWTNLAYKSGLRAITMGTNTGVGAASAYFVDMYPQGPCVSTGDRIIVTPVGTFGGAITIGTWSQLAYTPAVALPNGKYAIMGAYVAAMSYGGVIRFRHADFGQFAPGFPVQNFSTISSSTWDKIEKEDLLQGQTGWQFEYLSKVLGVPCCQVFSVTNAGTGLTIECNSQVADTPTVTLVLAKVG
jgi:hypothetical protein